MSFYETLVTETAAERGGLFTVPQIADGLAGRISLETYVAYLGQAYHHVRHPTRLLALAADELDDSHAVFRAALMDYIAEETGHERWILGDIARAGGDAQAAQAAPPQAPVAAMVDYVDHYVTQVLSD